MCLFLSGFQFSATWHSHDGVWEIGRAEVLVSIHQALRSAKLCIYRPITTKHLNEQVYSYFFGFLEINCLAY
jgi:hypothetical protein